MGTLPFTEEQFFAVFLKYNQAIWPAQLVAYALGLVAVALAIGNSRLSNRIVSGILALFWMWTGVMYHLAYFRPINPAATVFGSLFVVQAALLLAVGVVGTRLSFRPRRDLRGIGGGVMILYSLLLYPLLGYAQGHGYPLSPMFGVAPCPLVIFTLGILLWAERGLPGYLVLIPVLWAVVGSYAAVSLGVGEDFGLLAAGLLSGVLLLSRGLKKNESLPHFQGRTA